MIYIYRYNNNVIILCITITMHISTLKIQKI